MLGIRGVLGIILGVLGIVLGMFGGLRKGGNPKNPLGGLGGRPGLGGGSGVRPGGRTGQRLRLGRGPGGDLG